MQITKTTIKVRDLFEGYKDSQQNGVVAYGGRLDVRPAYQREFVYKDKQRDAVIDTLMKGFPLNTMYWVKKEDGDFEVLDGQQRTISICQYLESDFSIDSLYFHNLQQDLKDAIYNYELDVYVCEGGDTEKLEWFKTINIAGEKLSDQELRNAVYSGSWLSEAKRYFSYVGCPGVKVGDKYVVAEVIRQGLLEKAITWVAMRDDCTIEDYMARHQHDLDAADLWDYYRGAIEWIEGLFPYYRKEMKQVDWGTLYHKFGKNKYNPNELKKEVDNLMADEDVSKKAGIYPFIFTREEKYLSIRTFDTSTKRQKYEEQKGNCAICGNHFKIEEMEKEEEKKVEQHIQTQNNNYGKWYVVVSGGSPVIHIHNDGKNKADVAPEEMPEELKVALEKFRDKGILDESLNPLDLSNTDAAVLASVVSMKLWKQNNWVTFEKLWDINNLGSYYSKALTQKKTSELIDKYKSILA